MTALAWTLSVFVGLAVAFVLASMMLFRDPITPEPDPEPWGDVSEDRPSPVEDVRS